MIRLFLLLVVGISLNSCGTCWRGGESLRTVEVQSQQAVAKELRKAKNFRLYRGLAHPQRDPEVYARQLKEVDHVEIEGFRFHRQRLMVEDDVLRRLADLYCSLDSHQVLATPKTSCAGYHPDYALVWSDGGRRGVLQICYGCHEWKYFGAGGIFYSDINEPAYFDELMKWLPPHP